MEKKVTARSPIAQKEENVKAFFGKFLIAENCEKLKYY